MLLVSPALRPSPAQAQWGGSSAHCRTATHTLGVADSPSLELVHVDRIRRLRKGQVDHFTLYGFGLSPELLQCWALAHWRAPLRPLARLAPQAFSSGSAGPYPPTAAAEALRPGQLTLAVGPGPTDSTSRFPPVLRGPELASVAGLVEHGSGVGQQKTCSWLDSYSDSGSSSSKMSFSSGSSPASSDRAAPKSLRSSCNRPSSKSGRSAPLSWLEQHHTSRI